jgi:hypothetical protein
VAGVTVVFMSDDQAVPQPPDEPDQPSGDAQGNGRRPRRLRLPLDGNWIFEVVDVIVNLIPQ